MKAPSEYWSTAALLFLFISLVSCAMNIAVVLFDDQTKLSYVLVALTHGGFALCALCAFISSRLARSGR